MLDVEGVGPDADADERGVIVGYSVGEGVMRVSVGDMVGNVGVGPAAGARVSDPLFVDVGSAMGESTRFRVGSMVGAIAASLVAIGAGVGVEWR